MHFGTAVLHILRMIAGQHIDFMELVVAVVVGGDGRPPSVEDTSLMSLTPCCTPLD